MTIQCSNCGSEKSFYQKFSYYGSGIIHFDNTGSYLEDGSNSDMYVSAKHNVSKYLYCSVCNKRVIRIEEIN
ncbi:hypothetical protein MACA111363_02800 [Macrococcoides canis]|uniref:Uncharacterized protein n=1 Tax=Macrococcoides canis TaxID=1855823 RepID=A0A1W7ABV5_9STAP|nr:hypothetical protein MCCS_14280 [Macrococcus canis]